MTVACRRCGRDYDDALFELGRTLWCTCGDRVGIETPLRHLEDAEEQRFVADAMLGRLARWLRLLGIDCAFDAEIEDRELVRQGVTERRIILTRDRRLPQEWRVEAIHVVDAETLQAQLAEVLARFELAAALRPLTRCSRCNQLLVAASRSEIADRVPPRILRDHERFLRCPECGRAFWEGSHTERIRQTVDRLLGGSSGAPEATPHASVCRS